MDLDRRGQPNADPTQKLPAAEAYGDLTAMEWDPEQAHLTLRTLTDSMRKLALERAEAHEEEEAGLTWRRRAAELEAQIEEIDAVHNGE